MVRMVKLVHPTFAVVMSGLALGRVGYRKGLRFTCSLLIIVLIVYGVVLSIGACLPGTAF
jgi:uncharacterized ion transporter superfamily protein YfcC